MVLIRTIWSLGLFNVARVAVYRFVKKAGFYRWRLPAQSPLTGPVFAADEQQNDCPVAGSVESARLVALLSGRILLFGYELADIGSPPDWHRNAISGQRITDPRRHWSEYADFSDDVGDIKGVWEASRFAWAVDAARAYRLTGNGQYLGLLNDWTSDWSARNPANSGPNWMCAQECSIRLGHVLLADALLRREAPCPVALVTFVTEHLQRIAATISYARAQANNHIISESVALLVGGAWLGRHATDPTLQRRGSDWCERGRREFERQVRQLVLEDGTFSQYSTTYHRVLLDNLSIAEWWRRRLGLPAFSDPLHARAQAATEWLFAVVEPASGDAPNIGANDGALLFSLCDAEYRDFRPSLQLAGALFIGSRFYPSEGHWNEPLSWLGIEIPRDLHEEPQSRLHGDGGFAVLRPNTNADYVVCRFPVFRYRPSHADAMHVDLWSNGVNVLRDGGSYSYADADDIGGYFPGTESHNTCQFDDRDQMPKLGRFLFGDWLTCENLTYSESECRWSAAYKDHWGCRHARSVARRPDGWVVTDSVSGYRRRAIIRWRLTPEYDWALAGPAVTSEIAELRIRASIEPSRIELRDGFESRHYLSQSNLPVLEVELPVGNHELVTKIRTRA